MELILPKCWIKFSGFLLTHEILLIDEREISTLDNQIVTTLGLSFLISPDRRRGGGGWKEEGLAEATAAV